MYTYTNIRIYRPILYMHMRQTTIQQPPFLALHQNVHALVHNTSRPPPPYTHIHEHKPYSQLTHEQRTHLAGPFVYVLWGTLFWKGSILCCSSTTTTSLYNNMHPHMHIAFTFWHTNEAKVLADSSPWFTYFFFRRY